jgi:RNase P/RNase MRP subunit p29
MKEKIFELRKKGLSFNQIVEEIGCAKSTISYHCKKEGLSDIGLDELKRIKRGTKICEGCGLEFSLTGIPKSRKFCSRECYNSSDYLKDMGRTFGLVSSQQQKENRRSKNEIYFYELCKNHFTIVKSNESVFNGWDADVIIEDIKVAVLWNGKWHYEKITKKHSVKQVQNRDRIKIEEIKNCGYTPYVIKDMGREDKKFVELEFEKMIKNMPL